MERNQARREWFHVAKAIATSCITRADTLDRICIVPDQEPGQDALKKVAKLSRDVDRLARQLISLEAANNIGLSSIFHRKPTTASIFSTPHGAEPTFSIVPPLPAPSEDAQP